MSKVQKERRYDKETIADMLKRAAPFAEIDAARAIVEAADRVKEREKWTPAQA